MHIRKILSIDDEVLVNKIICKILETNGYFVVSAHNGSKAIELFDETFDLVILNNVMPDLSGKDTFLALKELDSDVKVLISSGAFTEDVKFMLENGALGFIMKPYGEKELIQRIEGFRLRSAYRNVFIMF